MPDWCAGCGLDRDVPYPAAGEAAGELQPAEPEDPGQLHHADGEGPGQLQQPSQVAQGKPRVPPGAVQSFDGGEGANIQ